MPGFGDILFSGGAQKGAASSDINTYANYAKAATSDLTQAYNTGTNAINAGIGAYQPLTALGAQYNTVAPMLTNALGLGGPTGSQSALSAFQGANPAYAFQQQQMQQAVNRGMAAGGMSNSGNLLDALQKNSANLANQSFQQWLNNLSGVAGLGANVAGQAAQGVAGGNYNLANLAAQYGQNQAGVQGNYASGVANANQLAAQGQAQGAQNMLGLGMALAGIPMSPNLATAGGGGGGGGGGGSSALASNQPYNFSNSPFGQAISGFKGLFPTA